MKKYVASAVLLVISCREPAHDVPPIWPTKPPGAAARWQRPPRIGVSVDAGPSAADCRESYGPFRVGGALAAPAILYRDDLAVRQAAARDGLRGQLIFEIAIGQNGQVGSAYLLSGPKQLEALAYESVMKWRFSRPMCAGRNVMALYNVTIAY